VIDFYGYPGCSTCRKAAGWLDEHGVAYRTIDITRDPPPAALLRRLIDGHGYALGALFNRSGQVYREMKLKDRLAAMDRAEALALLASHGKLVKRPVVADRTRATVGFDPARFAEVWG